MIQYMDVEVNHKKNILDLSIYFFSSNIQHIRRMENVYLILYLSFDHSWIIRQQMIINKRIYFFGKKWKCADPHSIGKERLLADDAGPSTWSRSFFSLSLFFSAIYIYVSVYVFHSFHFR
jgi:hypothetical protein